MHVGLYYWHVLLQTCTHKDVFDWWKDEQNNIFNVNWEITHVACIGWLTWQADGRWCSDHTRRRRHCRRRRTGARLADTSTVHEDRRLNTWPDRAPDNYKLSTRAAGCVVDCSSSKEPQHIEEERRLGVLHRLQYHNIVELEFQWR